MAREVTEVAPEAVVRGLDGYLRVDDGRLGLRLLTWQEWLSHKMSGAIPTSASTSETAPSVA
jgi:hypothetical protein